MTDKNEQQHGEVSHSGMLSLVSSWNVWGIPFASWRVFGRQQQWRGWCEQWPRWPRRTSQLCLANVTSSDCALCKVSEINNLYF